MTDTTTQDREAFEEEILATYSGEAAGFLDRDEDGFYIEDTCDLQIHWQVFQAACTYKEKQIHEHIAHLVAAARAEEREACAQVCEGLVYDMAIVSWRDMSKKEHGAHVCRQAALAIRSRSDEAIKEAK